MSKLTIVAHIITKAESAQTVRQALEKLVPITREEEGCLQYDLHCDNNNPNHFLFYENWASRALWQAHMNTPHIAAFMKDTDGMVAEFTVHELTHIA